MKSRIYTTRSKTVNDEKSTFTSQKEPIAVVGIGCRIPGNGITPETFWDFLLSGENAISTVPEDRWNVEEFYDPNPNKAGKIKTNKAGFISGIDEFDNEFFNIFPSEAERIDPQQRLLLMATYEALEDAGDKLEQFKGSNTAVFVGHFMNDYWDMQVDTSNRYAVSPHVAMGSSITSLANRISYLYDLHGPSVTVDTACSASLVAVHLACRSIWSGESESAIAGGVNVMINPLSTVMMSKGNFLSPDGACKAFDESANGYVRSEGAGLVYLKPLSKAIADGNKIYGVIKGTSCNSDGFTPEGFTVPSKKAQKIMLERAYKDAGVNVNDVQYIEAHGTGTPVGDPIETGAFAEVFGGRKPENPLLIGSVKSNVGHLEGAAGIIGLIKLSLCIKNKKIPGNLHFNSANPKLPLKEGRLQVVGKTTDWEAPATGKRIGGINSFGAGGTNAHVVMEEYIPEEKKHTNQGESAYLFTIGAQTESALKSLLETYKAFIPQTPASLRDICYSVGKHRSGMQTRIAIVAADKDELVHKIEAYLNGNPVKGITTGNSVGNPQKLGYIFTGQGPQWFAMGRELMADSPSFKNTILQIEALFKPLAEWSLLEEMYKCEAESNISDTRIAQPAIMAIQIGLIELWKSHGINPDGVIGHSIGEVAAAYAAGSLSLEQAVQVIFHRSRGQHAATGKGKMLAVGLNLQDVKPYLAGVEHAVSIAAVNGPASLTLAGDVAPLEEISMKFSEKDIFNKFLMVNVPFHSHHMEPLKEELIDSLQSLEASLATKPLYSTVTGKLENGSHLNSEYWYANVRKPVYFSPALDEMLKDGYNLFIELGPHPALSGNAEELFAARSAQAKVYPSLRRKEPEYQTFLNTLGAVFCQGIPLDWDTIYKNAHKIELPRYNWQLKKFWYEAKEHKAARLGKKVHPLIASHSPSANNSDNHTFQLLLDRHIEPYLDDHRVNDAIIFPATGHLEIATAAAQHAFGNKFAFLEDINFESGLFLPEEGEPIHIKLEVYSDENRYVISSLDNKEGSAWVKHSNGKMNTTGDQFIGQPVVLSELQARIDERLPVQPLYNELKQAGLFYGQTFKSIELLYTGNDEILGKINTHESIAFGLDNYNIHPSILDACLHTIFSAQMKSDNTERGFYLPIHIDRYRCHKKADNASFWSYVKVRECSDLYLSGDFWVMDEEGEIIAEVQGLTCKYIEGSKKQNQDIAYSGCYEYAWEKAENLNLKPAPTKVILVRDGDARDQPLIDSLSAHHIEMVEWQGDLLDRANAVQSLQSLRQQHGDISKVVVTLGTSQQLGSLPVEESTLLLSQKILNLFAALIHEEFQACVWLIGENASMIKGDEQINIHLAPMYGLARVMNNENPSAIVKIADVGSLTDQHEIGNLCSVIGSTSNGGNDTEFGFRDNTIFAHKLLEVTRSVAQTNAMKKMPAIGGQYEAFFKETKILDSIDFRAIALHELGDDEVEIAVHAAALNFKDVLNGMGLLTAESVKGGLVGADLGLECSGVVTRTGKNVQHVRVGDEVVAMAAKSLAGMTKTPQHCVVKKPSHLSHLEASTLTVVFLTAYHCLLEIGRLEQGEKVLIHSATGGVGLAAIQIANLVGAEVYATVGNDSKKELLQALGVKHIYSSKTLNFHDEIMRDTNGYGVDVVLNSLTGKSIVQSLKTLAKFGRFVEIGKTEIYNDAAIYLKRFGENLSYSAVDIDRLMAQKPQKGRQLFKNVIQLFEKQQLQPLPYQAFPITELSGALSYMAKGQHIGKIILDFAEQEIQALPAASLRLDKDATYIITGGASGFGLEIAKWFATLGARHLSLASRSGAKSDYDKKWIQQLQKEGVKVRIDCLDLANGTEVQAWLADICQTSCIGGIVHGAAVLSDSTIPNMDGELFKKAFLPKAIGAWHLYNFIKELDIKPDFFVNLSSISATIGLPGQANYASANNFLDKLVERCRSEGIPAQSVNIGVMGNYAGMSKDAHGVMSVLDSQGWEQLSLKQITSKIERIILDGSVVRMAANINWQKFRDFFPHLKSDLKFAHLLSDEALNLKNNKTTGDALIDKLNSLAEGEAQLFLVEALKTALARILGTAPDKIDDAKSISSIGLDSLMMNQLRNWIQQKLEYNYPLMRMVKGPSLTEMSAHIYEDLKKLQSSAINNLAPEAKENDEVALYKGWFMRHKNMQNNGHKLFMFHSMGAAASMFGHFIYNPPADTDVYCIQLPGRENRLHEPIFTELPALLDELEKQISPLIEDGRFTFYGHSFGGIIAFELIRRLRRKGLMPEHFFCSATMAPHITLTWKNRDVMAASTISSNSEQKLLGLMSYIDDLDFVKQILPGMRRDMPLLMGYDYQEETPLSCPITVFSAIEDEVTLPAEMAAWEKQTSAAFKQEMVHGDHWFVSRNKEFIAAQIAKALKNHDDHRAG